MASDYEKAHRLSKILTTIDFPCAHGMVGQQKNPGSERLGVSFFGGAGVFWHSGGCCCDPARAWSVSRRISGSHTETDRNGPVSAFSGWGGMSIYPHARSAQRPFKPRNKKTAPDRSRDGIRKPPPIWAGVVLLRYHVCKRGFIVWVWFCGGY